MTAFERDVESVDASQRPGVTDDDRSPDGVDLDRPAGSPASGPVPTGAGGSWDARIAALAELDGRPLAEHADAYDALHTDLKRRLGEVDGR